MRKRLELLLFFFWIISGFRVLAQTSPIAFTRFTTQHGLSSNVITSLAKDRRGFLWIGTINGLNRFDGLSFKVFKSTGATNGLPSNYINLNGLTTDSQGYLWISTTRGLLRFDPWSETGIRIPLPQNQDQQGDNDFTSPVFFDREGWGWFTTYDKLYRIHPRTLAKQAFDLPFAIPSYYPEPFLDSKGRLWLSLFRVLYRFDRKKRQFQYVQGHDRFHPNEVPFHSQRMLETKSGDLYTFSHPLSFRLGLCRYDAVKKKFILHPTPAVNVSTMTEEFEKNGSSILWLGSFDRIFSYQPQTQELTPFKNVPEDPASYPGGRTNIFLKDTATHIIWLGTTQGLAAKDPNAQKLYRRIIESRDDSRLPMIQTVRQDIVHDEVYWALTQQSGLIRWDRRQNTLERLTAPQPTVGAYGFIQDRSGKLWVGSKDGVSTYEPRSRQWETIKITPFQGSNYPKVNTHMPVLCQDASGKIWIGSLINGLFWYDPASHQLKRWPHPLNGQPNFTINRIQEDAQRRLWLLTNRGILRLDAERKNFEWLTFRGLPSGISPTDELHSTFYLDRNGNWWHSGIGFLVKADYDGKVLQTYTLKNGLTSDHIFGICEDQRGHLWLHTDERLHELDPTKKPGQAGLFQYYSQSSDGLMGSDGILSGNLFDPITRNRSGELFISASEGFNYFKPGDLRKNTLIPPVWLTEIRINNQVQPLDTTQQITLHPGDNTLTVSFTTLNFSQSRKNQYAYRLLGFDKEWLVTSARTATYTNLAPGDYELWVRASNNDGVWNKRGTRLWIHVIPAYYQTYWFKALIGLLVLGILYGIFRYRMAQQQHLALIRDRIATDLHDDIGSTLSSIRIFSEVVQGQIADVRPDSVPLLKRISDNASTLAESMQDIIWTIKSNQEGLDDLVSRMREFALRLTEARGIVLNMTVGEPFPILRLSVEQRRNLYLIFKESINNAVKYSACSRIDVRLSVEGRVLHLKIQDNGTGFDQDHTRSGNGLPNLHARARDIRGTIVLHTAPGQGTSITLTATIR
ncbi:sensor histidine kinase [Siphonobacter curvatus]|uniref:Histidine kinase domain-containing protein n=1 Tax=Siphonobacter curvatus TaxID=2094562 RepID=A0A2S7IGM3_9BACT|nr:two-component regulator propeller domain-containing protein [Siphonobacter curvatus]PQA54552.1 hypothetical protein C5O19_22665 [Siphonobacter curvatus]